MQELAGEWKIELPARSLIFPDGMEGWQETKFVLNEDGTCEIHNLTLSMTNPYLNGKEYPEWTGRKLTGTWESIPRSVSGYPEGSKVWTEKVYAAIIIHGEEDHTIENRRNCWCSRHLIFWEKPEYKPGTEDNDYYCSGFIMVWKVKEDGKETYRLRMFGDPGNYEFLLDRCGIILKRVE